ncbi:hypothetical protein L2E82_49019 [Cichorium intybus]|uniref:Uncharacterized protein n=1 Tax=Cichorium intybus TaxID=13427 RepID=A0ACB8Z017_CICIN|nr:hypothetical protein L2E82_49019 [Cichorium intybus]
MSVQEPHVTKRNVEFIEGEYVSILAESRTECRSTSPATPVANQMHKREQDLEVSPVAVEWDAFQRIESFIGDAEGEVGNKDVGGLEETDNNGGMRLRL